MDLIGKREEYAKLLNASLEETVDKLSRLDNVKRISTFGSYPAGKADLFSDLDILVIMETDKSFLERMRELYSLLALPVDVDILCYTPEEFDGLKKTPFMRRILSQEVCYYEAAGKHPS